MNNQIVRFLALGFGVGLGGYLVRRLMFGKRQNNNQYDQNDPYTQQQYQTHNNYGNSGQYQNQQYQQNNHQESK